MVLHAGLKDFLTHQQFWTEKAAFVITVENRVITKLTDVASKAISAHAPHPIRQRFQYY
jgi:hypothetical protein